jgi:hypothetical protein
MEARRQKRDYTTEFRIVLPDGTVKYLEAEVHHLFELSPNFGDGRDQAAAA